jgi:hypothetical protein
MDHILRMAYRVSASPDSEAETLVCAMPTAESRCNHPEIAANANDDRIAA